MRLANSPVLLVTLLLGTQVWAQAPNPAVAPAPGDPFAQVHDALSTAADTVLAAAAQLPAEPQMSAAIPALGAQAQDELSLYGRVNSQARALQRVEQLRPVIEPILREENVPTELIAVVVIESGGQPMALSPRGARGIWQFMPDTARRYGLVVSPGKDDRLDVQKSTRAAARYLHHLYDHFGNWPVALAAYNAGEDTVDAALARAGSADFPRISARLPLETQAYVPAVLGAMGRVPVGQQPPGLPRSSARLVVYAVATLD